MSREQIKEQLLALAQECSALGPGYAQEGHLLRTMRERLRPTSLQVERTVLDCWHELFREGRIVWGHNLDNPSAPFFHFPVTERVPA